MENVKSRILYSYIHNDGKKQLKFVSDWGWDFFSQNGLEWPKMLHGLYKDMVKNLFGFTAEILNIYTEFGSEDLSIEQNSEIRNATREFVNPKDWTTVSFHYDGKLLLNFAFPESEIKNLWNKPLLDMSAELSYGISLITAVICQNFLDETKLTIQSPNIELEDYVSACIEDSWDDMWCSEELRDYVIE